MSTLLVVDHAETRTGELASLVNGLAGRQGVGTVRLLLLAHAAGDWWEGLRREVGILGSVLDGVVELKLAPLHSTLDSRQHGVRQAVAAFARYRGHPAAPAAMPSLADPRYGSVLDVHVARLPPCSRPSSPPADGTGQPSGTGAGD